MYCNGCGYSSRNQQHQGMLANVDGSLGLGQAHPAQQGDGKLQWLTGLELQPSKGDPAFIGHEEAEAEKSEANRENQANHLFV